MANIAEEIEIRNAVGQARQGCEEAQQNAAEQGNVNNTNNGNDQMLPRHENRIRQLSDTSTIKPVYRRHTI